MKKLLILLSPILFFTVFCSEAEKRKANGADTLYIEAPVYEKTSERPNDTNIQGLPQEGVASFYANSFQGKTTASGEPYDSARYTAAHRSLPFGTKLKITNLRNDKTVVVTVNDRGPHHKKRIIDLSRAAAKELNFIERGTTKVRIEEVVE